MKTVIFDFGNVVGLFDHNATLQKLTPHTNLSVKEMFDRVYRGPLEDEIEKGRIGVPEFLRRVHALWELSCDISFLERAIADIFTPNPEVCGLIPKLRPRYRVLLGSNTNAIHANHFRRQFADVFAHFDALVMSHEIGARKPEQAFYERCQQLADAEPSEVVFVDDLAANIEGARRYGWHGIIYRPNNGLLDDLRGLGIAA